MVPGPTSPSRGPSTEIETHQRAIPPLTVQSDMEGEAGRHRSVISQYFGELLDDVARDGPVSRDRLVEVLAGGHVTAHRLGLRTDGGTRVLQEGSTETVLAVPERTWETLTADAGDRERAAARECHVRMAAALSVDSPGSAVPIVLPDSLAGTRFFST